MTALEPVDTSALQAWIGRTERATDLVTPGLVQRLLATLDRSSSALEDGAEVPATAHWCLAPPAVTMSGLGPDGHPARGGFLPPVPLPRRMWAGGVLDINDRIRVGDLVERESRIAEVTVKKGRTGTLCFVTVEHRIFTPRGTAITERQDIVYRDIERVSSAASVAPDPRVPRWRQEVAADPILLFRYSALTFNGHRIHYDRRHCVDAEGYPGLVVHGPLQATLLMELAVGIRDGQAPRRFSFRGARPLFDGPAFSVNAVEAEGGLDLWTADAGGAACMTAKAAW